jgi:hypothetical protein
MEFKICTERAVVHAHPHRFSVILASQRNAFPLQSRPGFVTTAWAASAYYSGLRALAIASSPPAAVAKRWPSDAGGDVDGEADAEPGPLTVPEHPRENPIKR